MIFDRFRKNKTKVSISSINLKFSGSMHSINGMEVKEKIFTLNIPFQNKIGSGLLHDGIKGPKVVINNIKISEPFTLVDIFPNLPIEIEYLSRIVFKIRLTAPDLNYSGPVTIDFGNETKDDIKVNIEKIVLLSKGRKTELEESSLAFSMQKGQIFKHSLQLYRFLSYGDRVEKIDVNAPFSIVSTEPKLPINLDKKDSYMMNLYFKLPEFNYAGILEITFK